MPMSVGSIMLNLGLNTAPLSTQIKGAAAGAQTQLVSAFRTVSSVTAGSLSELSAKTGKSMSQLRSEAARLAQAYIKSGMTQSAAMSRAYREIGLVSTQAKTAKNGVRQLGAEGENSGNRIKRAFGGIGSLFSGLFAKLGGLMAAAFALGRIKAMVQQWQALYRTQIESEIKLSVTMRNATNATMEQIQAVKDLASHYQQLGVIGDEVQLAGMQELATYVKSVESVKKLMPVLNDMVAQQYGYDATGGAAVGIATMLGKVMNGSTTALSRYGYDFTEEQGNIIKYGTEAEKVATVTEVIEASVANMNEALAQTPTGRMKQLSNNFGDLKESLGSLTVNLAAPFVSALNVIVVKLTQAFNALSRFTAAMLKIKSFSFLGLGKSADSASDSIDGVAKSAGGAGKAVSKSLMGFDQLNRLDGSGGGGGGIGEDDASLPFSGEDMEELNEFAAKVAYIKSLFAEGFKIGFASADLKAIKNHAESVRQALISIFASDEVQDASRKFSDTVILNFGKMIGSIGSIGATLAENFLGGAEIFLQSRGDSLRNSIAGLFDIRAEIVNSVGDWFASIGEIFSAWKSQGGKRITASMMSIFTDAIMNVVTTVEKLARDVFGALAKPFIDNAESMKTTAEKVLRPIGKIFSVLSDAYHELCGVFQTGYDSFVKPVFAALGDSASKLWTHIQPMWEKMSGFLDRIGELIKAAWDKAQPFIPVLKAIAEQLGRLLAPLFAIFGDAVISGFGELFDAISMIFDVLSGLLDFVVGVFSGDWKQAWDGIKSAAGSLWDYIKQKFQANVVVSYFTGIWNRVKNAFTSIGTQIGGAIGSSVKSAINSVIGQVQSRVNSGISLINSALKIVGGKKIASLNLPRLAQGGYVRANTPQLAMIGDNRRYGEIVAPEDKMLEMILTALRLFNQQNPSPKPQNEENQLIELVVNLGDETLVRKIIRLLREENRRGNYVFLV